jgi:transposase
MWKPYKNVSEALIPQAEVVADRFHVMKQVNEELDRSRKKIKKAAEVLKNSSEKSRVLSGIKTSKYVVLKNEEALTEIEKFKLEAVKKVAPTLKKMHMKEESRQIFESPKDWVERLLTLNDWLKDAISVFPKSCGTIIRSIEKIIAYFDRRITQGVVEGINNKLKLFKRKAYGFRNFDNFILRSFLRWHFAS